MHMTKRALILAPHPDDESIIGLLPLRLQEECGFEVWVVPATLGSRVERQAARKRELRAACAELGFRLRGLDQNHSATGLRGVLESIRPAVIVLPHAKDGHPTHRATQRLGVAAMDALRGAAWNVVETEYWHPLERPNLMVAADEAQVRRLCRALACHTGEIARNDYAARLPAWMIDNVRRGAELVGGAGTAAPDFAYATLYRARIRAKGAWRLPFKGGRLVESSEDLGALVGLWA
jgi:N-acetylglucosamine malate deacetylase 1